MLGRAGHHLDHVLDLRGMAAGDKGGPAVDQFAHRIDGLIDCAGRVGLALEADGRGGRSLLFGQTVNLIVHDDVGQVDVFAGHVIEVIAANGEPVAVAAEDEDLEVGAAQADAGGKWHGTTMDEVSAMGVDEVGEPGRAADTGHRDDIFVRVIELFEGAVKGREHREVTATRAPRGMIGGEGFFGEFGGFRSESSFGHV